MRVISKKRLREFWEENLDAEKPLLVWYNVARRATWGNPADMKRDFSYADLAGKCTIFDIKGNDYRLIAKVEYAKQIIFIKEVLSHADYDKGRWKDGCGC